MSSEQKLARARANLQLMQDLLTSSPNDPLIRRAIQRYQEEINSLETPTPTPTTNPVLPGSFIKLKLWDDRYFSTPSEELSIEGERMFATLSNPNKAVTLQLVKPEIHDEPTGWHIQITLDYPKDSNGNPVPRDGWNVGRYGELYLKRGTTPSLYYWLVGFTSAAYEDRRDDFYSTVWEFYDPKGNLVPVPEYDTQYRIKNMKNGQFMVLNGSKVATNKLGSFFIIRPSTPSSPIQADHGLVSDIIQAQVGECSDISDPIERAKCLTKEAAKEVVQEAVQQTVTSIPWWVYVLGAGTVYLMVTK